MIRLTKALSGWGSPDFEGILKQEIEQLGVKDLPLQQGLSSSSYAMDNKLNVLIINVAEQADLIRAKVGLFYTGIIAGCNCADDPTPADEQSEYCEIQVDINKNTAETNVILLPE